jgi:hypothetical protein
MVVDASFTDASEPKINRVERFCQALIKAWQCHDLQTKVYR